MCVLDTIKTRLGNVEKVVSNRSTAEPPVRAKGPQTAHSPIAPEGNVSTFAAAATASAAATANTLAAASANLSAGLSVTTSELPPAAAPTGGVSETNSDQELWNLPTRFQRRQEQRQQQGQQRLQTDSQSRPPGSRRPLCNGSRGGPRQTFIGQKVMSGELLWGGIVQLSHKYIGYVKNDITAEMIKDDLKQRGNVDVVSLVENEITKHAPSN